MGQTMEYIEGVYRRTNNQCKSLHVLVARPPSSTEKPILLFECLKNKLELVLPVLNTTSNGDNTLLSNGHPGGNVIRIKGVKDALNR